MAVAPNTHPGVSRKQAIQAIMHHLADAPLNDQRIGALLSFAKQKLPQLDGERLLLTADDRREIASKIEQAAHPSGNVYASLVLFVVDACAADPDEALVRSVSDVLIDSRLCHSADLVRDVLNRFRLGDSPSTEALERILQLLLASSGNLSQLIAAFKLSGLVASTPLETRHAVFDIVVLPVMRSRAPALGSNAMLLIEQLLYNNYIKIEERAEHHKATFAALEPIFRDLAQKDKRPRPRLPAPAKRPRVAFILYNGSRLAHTELLITLLRGMRQLEEPPIDAAIYLLTNVNAHQLVPICEELAIPLLVDPTPADSDIIARFDRCRSSLERQQISAAVFVSVTIHLCYLAWAPIAPVQIWLKMKFPLPNFEGLEGRILYCSLFQRERSFLIDGATWRGGPMGILPPPEASQEDIRAVRSRYPYRKIIGTIAREEKIREPAFLIAVISILQRHRDVGFLWTGRNRLPEIEASFQEAGVAERCHFIGWVDPAVYCRVFDIFLETFPLTGLMAAWAMHAGVPVISVGEYGYLGINLLGVFNGSVPVSLEERAEIDAIFAPIAGKLPAPWAESPDQIESFATALLNDDRLTADFGRAGQDFIHRFLCDPVESARIQLQHIADIVAECRDRTSIDTEGSA